MIPAPGVQFAALDSTGITEDGNELSIWLTLTDGSTVGVYLTVAELIRQGRCIVEPTHTPSGVRSH